MRSTALRDDSHGTKLCDKRCRPEVRANLVSRWNSKSKKVVNEQILKPSKVPLTGRYDMVFPEVERTW